MQQDQLSVFRFLRHRNVGNVRSSHYRWVHVLGAAVAFQLITASD